MKLLSLHLKSAIVLMSLMGSANAAEDGRIKVALLVGQGSEISDGLLAQRLVKSDFAVTVVAAGHFDSHQTSQYDLLVISESVNSADLADKVDDLKLPIVCLEPSLFDDLKLTGTQWQGDFGDAIAQTRLMVQVAETPLNAGLKGSVAVVGSGEKFTWGRPLQSAINVASLVDGAGHQRWGIFGYESGSDLTIGKAPSRRVGWFAGRDTAQKLTREGWLLFDAAVRWASRRRILFVVGEQPPRPSDQQMIDFVSRRFQVDTVVKLGSAVVSADLIGMQVVVISESVSSDEVKGAAVASSAPLVVLEPALFDDLGMTGTTWQRDFGDLESQRQIQIREPSHPLAAGLTGPVSVMSEDASKFVWGSPGPLAIKIATLSASTTAFAIFAYEKGASMVQGTAPNRRVGWFAGRDTFIQLNYSGVSLFEQAIAWAGRLPFASTSCSSAGSEPCQTTLVTQGPINPAASQPIPGYQSAPHYGCEPAIAAGNPALDPDGNAYFQSLGYPTDPAICRAPALFCDSNDQPIAAPSVEQLNSTDAAFLAPCPALKGSADENCGVDPRTLSKECSTSSDCPAGMICAVVCSDAACLGATRRCGTEYASCAAVPAEDNLCDTREVRECPDPRALGVVFAEHLEAQLAPQAEESPSIKVPDSEKPKIEPFEELTGALCGKTPAEDRAEARQGKAADSKQGNDQWGFFVAPTAEQRFDVSLKSLAEQTFEVGGSAGLKAGVLLMGKKVTALEVLLDVSLQHCGQRIGGTVKVFGDAVVQWDGGKGVTIMEPSGDGFATSPTKKFDCNSKFMNRNNKASDLSRALFMSRAVKEFYLEHGTTKDLCKRSNAQLGFHQNCDDPDLINNINIPNAWAEEYENASKDFFDADQDFNFSKDKISGGGEISLLDSRHRYSLAATQVSFLIGPVPVVLAFEAFGTWGLSGSIQYGVMYGKGLPELLTSLTIPMATMMSDPADIRLLAGPVVTPSVSVDVAAFAGVGFTALSLGLEGTLQMLTISLPLDARIVASRIGEADPRDVANSDWAGSPIDQPSLNKAWKWKYGWAFGAHLDIEAMKGQIDAALRVRFLFVKKTFRKRITKWSGYTKRFSIVGKEYGDPLTGVNDLGAFVDKVAYTHGTPLNGQEVIRQPDPDAYYPDVLGREECGIVVE